MTLHPYWPMKTAIKYQVYEIEGVHDRPSGIVGVTKFMPHGNSPQIVTPLRQSGSPATAMHYHAPGQDPLTGDALVEAEWGDYIGEIAYRDTWQTPPLPIRTGLFEDNPDPHPSCAYNYVFQRGIGMVCFFYVAMLPGETPKGIYYHAVEW